MIDKHSPVLPTKTEKADVAAFQALEIGEATPEQQKRCLKFLESACGTYDLSYRPDNQYETAFAEGKRWVGLQIVKLRNLNMRIYDLENPNG